MILLTACSFFKPKERIVYVNNYCTLDVVIEASLTDKQALKESKVSKEFILQIRNHNDLWKATCLKELSADIKLSEELLKISLPQTPIEGK